MTSVDYLLARLPPLDPDLVALPIGPEEFSDLILDGDIRFWASGVLDWLRIANWCSNHRNLPVPFPYVKSEPSSPVGLHPWREYYDRHSAIHAPDLVRAWAREDAALVSARARVGGRDLALQVRHTLEPRMQILVSGAAGTIEAAAAQDAKLTRLSFQWLNERVFCRARDSEDLIYVYAIKLLLLARVGRRIEASDAA
jgi:hypothetical protein